MNRSVGCWRGRVIIVIGSYHVHESCINHLQFKRLFLVQLAIIAAINPKMTGLLLFVIKQFVQLVLKLFFVRQIKLIVADE